MELPTALKWKTRPGYSESSTPWKEALLMVPSILSTGASKRRCVADGGVSKVGPFLSVPLHISEIYWCLKDLLMKRAALYMRVSTLDQHPETQLYDLREMAKQRGYRIVEEYTDMISSTKARRPRLDAMMRDARRDQFDVVLVWACDRIARSTKHFLEVLDELNRLNIEFISFREQIDTGGPLGRAVVVIIGAIAELERSLIVERVRAGMRR